MLFPLFKMLFLFSAYFSNTSVLCVCVVLETEYMSSTISSQCVLFVLRQVFYVVQAGLELCNLGWSQLVAIFLPQPPQC